MDQWSSNLDELGDVLTQVEASVDKLTQVDLGLRGRAELSEVVLRIQRLRNQCDAIAAEAAHESSMAGVQLGDNLRTIADYVGAHTTTNPARIRVDRNRGWWMAQYPAIQAAALAGEITTQHLKLLKECDNPRTREALRETQQVLVDAARDCAWDDFLTAIRYWMLTFDPDGKEPNAQHQGRYLKAHKNADGTVTGSFSLDPVAGDAFLSAINRHVDKLRQQDQDQTPAADNQEPERTDTHRKADALVELTCKGATRADGTLPQPLIHLVLGVTVAVDLLKRYGSCAEDLPRYLPLDPNDPNRRCELADGTPIHPKHVWRHLQSGEIRRLVLTGDDRIDDLSQPFPGTNGVTVDNLLTALTDTPSASLSSPGRFFPPHLRNALTAAARGRCAVPGCNAPLWWLQADHIKPHAAGGQTHTDNGQMLCAYHNGLKSNTVPSVDRKPPATPKTDSTRGQWAPQITQPPQPPPIPPNPPPRK